MVLDIDIVRNELQDLLGQARSKLSRIWIRLLAFNVLLIFLPAVGLFYFEVYEEELLESQEQSMVQQGRLLAAALADSQDLAQDATSILNSIYPETISRLRIIDRDGLVLADSSRVESTSVFAATVESRQVTDDWLYKVGQTLFNLATRIPRSQPGVAPESSYDPISAPEVTRALRGSYGAYWRVSPGQRSVTLYSAVPIRRGDQVLGAVLVSQSTFRVLQKLYLVRLSVFKIVLISVFAAILLSLLVAKTIASPLQDLQKRAAGIAERKGELRSMFEHSTRRDEIGDLERALSKLSHRLGDRIQFIESFASDLSHELKNPLASIRTATELAKDVRNPSDRKRFLQVIETEVARMEHLISRVQEVTSVDSNIEQETRQILCLNHFLKEFLEGFELLHCGDVTMRFESPESLLHVEVYPDHLAQVLENLLVNSVSFSAENSPIDVSLAQSQQWAVVSIKDYGPGIPEEHREKIFDRFFSHRPGEQGAKSHHAGLGLAIVRAIVEGYGGKVEAVSVPGNGAMFNFRLKLASQVKIDPAADLN